MNDALYFADPQSIISQCNVESGMSVADFGAGVGFYALRLSHVVGVDGMVYAIDILPDHISKIRKEAEHRGLRNIEVILANVERPQGSALLAGSMDRVFISNILFQCDHPERVAEEAKRVLKPSGRVVVIDWNESYNQIGPHSDHIINEHDVHKAFEATGFEVDQRLDAGSHHYGFLYKLKT
jgi:ubiquinone/menaquinone biosynthesis C-methylase UbiE